MNNTTFWLFFYRLTKKKLVLFVFLPNNPISHMLFLLTRGKRSVRGFAYKNVKLSVIPALLYDV